MRKGIIIILLIFANDLLFAQDDIFKATWITTPVKVDGSSEEWSQPLRYYDSDTKLSFAFANDEKNLYLCFQTNDHMNEMKIMHAGMEITLNIKGEHKATINFPLEQGAETQPPGNENNGQPNVNSTNGKNISLTKNTMMEVKGFTTKNGMIPINDSSGINAAINPDPGNKLTYEISIPLRELFGINYTAADISKHISLGVEINAMKGVSHSGNNAGDNFSGKTGGGGRGGGGGRMGGGSGGGHHNRGTNTSTGEENTEVMKEDKTDMSKKSEFKQKFILAQKDAPKN